MAREDHEHIARLRALLEVTRLVRSHDDLTTLLAAIARTVADALGYHAVVVNLYRPAWNDFEVTTVEGSDAEILLGTTGSWESWQPLLHDRFLRRGAYFVQNGEFDWETLEHATVVPDLEISDDPDAWHPEDALFVPMASADGEPLGILSVDEPESGRRPTDDELDVLVSLAEHAALAVQAAQEAAVGARHRAALEQLLEVSSQLAGTGPIEPLLQAVCDAIRDALGFQRVSLNLIDPGSGNLRAEAAAGWDASDRVASIGLGVEYLEPLLTPAFEREGCYLATDDQARELLEPRAHAYRSELNGKGPHAWSHHWLVVPLVDRGGALMGVIWADDPDDRLVPSADKLQALRLFANQATTALLSAQQFHEAQFLADHDPLTRLGNRRAFIRRVEREAERGARYGTGFALVVCDLDGFKSLNDGFGHLAGDDALCDVAAALLDAVRASDGAFRIGGDEFALVLVETSRDEARDVVSRIGRTLTSLDHAVRASFGIAVFPVEGDTPEALFRRADEAMYTAKRSAVAQEG
jgi:diguanylate cyclase (GGDEF)-like protein